MKRFASFATPCSCCYSPPPRQTRSSASSRSSRRPASPTPATRCAGISADGKVTFFESTAAVSSDDGDGAARDVYTFSGGTTTLISDRVQAGGDAGTPAAFRASSTDGSVVAFATDEPLVAADGDTVSDIYVHSGTTTTLVSDRVNAGGDGSDIPTFDRPVRRRVAGHVPDRASRWWRPTATPARTSTCSRTGPSHC